MKPEEIAEMKQKLTRADELKSRAESLIQAAEKIRDAAGVLITPNGRVYVVDDYNMRAFAKEWVATCIENPPLGATHRTAMIDELAKASMDAIQELRDL